MNLPFSPTFFREIDIFQQLMEYESQKDKKLLWKGEKAVLVWGASDRHQFLDEGLTWEHAKKALAYCVEKKFITESERVELTKPTLRTHIIRSLPVHEFGDFLGDESSPVRINRNGILAGAVLTETDFLNKRWRYQVWICAWWLILVAAGLILVSQTVAAAKNLFVSGLFSQEKVNNSRHGYCSKRIHNPGFDMERNCLYKSKF